MALYNNQFQPYPMFPQQGINSPIAANPMPQVLDTGIIWVQGESGAKAYPVAPGKSMALFDSEVEQFFIKSVDASGMPQPLRIFSYSENSEVNTKTPEIDTSVFITRDEFERVIGQLKQKSSTPLTEQRNRGGQRNGKSLIQPTE